MKKELVTIGLKDSVKTHMSNDDGDILFNKILSTLKDNKDVLVDLDGVPGLNTSFINSAFIQLLDHFSFWEIQKRLGFINGNKQIYNLVKSRFHKEVSIMNNEGVVW